MKRRKKTEFAVWVASAVGWKEAGSGIKWRWVRAGPIKEVTSDEGLEEGDIWGKSVSGQSTARAKALRLSNWSRGQKEREKEHTGQRD